MYTSITLTPREQDKVQYARVLYAHGAPIEGMARNLLRNPDGTSLPYDRAVLLARRAAYDIEGWADAAWEEATAGPMREWFRVLRSKPADEIGEEYLDWCWDAAEAWSKLTDALADAEFYREHADQHAAKRPANRSGVPFQRIPLTSIAWRN